MSLIQIQEPSHCSMITKPNDRTAYSEDCSARVGGAESVDPVKMPNIFQEKFASTSAFILESVKPSIAFGVRDTAKCVPAASDCVSERSNWLDRQATEKWSV